MKKIILTLFLAIMATTGLDAQQISVVSSGGSTSLYRTFPEAIEGAAPGSVIYLPGGGFSIDDSVKITKKLTIIGIGHYNKSGNVDGVTTISGNLWFNEGSSGSAVMGCYITGTVYIGHDDAAVNNILVKYCNADHIDSHANSIFTIVNQCYLRKASQIRGEGSTISNNVINTLQYCNSAHIKNNIIISSYGTAFYNVNNSQINNNIIRNVYGDFGGGSYNQINNNMSDGKWGDYYINLLEGTTWNDVFVDYNGRWGESAVTTSNNFHFKEAYKQYENQVGIYAGTGFNDQQIAPVPYIVAKRVDEQTDASGKLNVKIRVKAGE